MNHSLKMFDAVVSRMAGGQRAEFDRLEVEQAFPHPPKLSKLMMELEIRRLLSAPRGTVKPRPEPPTQQEKIDKWAKARGLRVHRDMMTENLHVEKLRPKCPRCEVPMVPGRGKVRLDPLYHPAAFDAPREAVVRIGTAAGLRCPGCGKFEPLKD